MAGTNDYLQFAASGDSSTVETQAAYLVDSTLSAGMVAGVVPSTRLNKILRQATMASAVLGQIIANNGVNASDDGNVSNFITNLLPALGIGSLRSAPAITGSGSLASSSFGTLQEITSSTTCTTTLPTAVGNSGKSYKFVNNSSVSQNLALTGSVPGAPSNCFFFNGATLGASLTLLTNESLELISDGGNWICFGGSFVDDLRLATYALQSQLNTRASHVYTGGSVGQSDWFYLDKPNGLIAMMGIQLFTAPANLTLPASFTTAVLSAHLWDNGSNHNAVMATITNPSTVAVTCSAYNTTANFIVIGY